MATGRQRELQAVGGKNSIARGVRALPADIPEN